LEKRLISTGRTAQEFKTEERSIISTRTGRPKKLSTPADTKKGKLILVPNREDEPDEGMNQPKK